MLKWTTKLQYYVEIIENLVKVYEVISKCLVSWISFFMVLHVVVIITQI